MNAFQQYAKKLDANPNIPAEIAHFFKLGFLRIELTSEQGKLFDAWLHASKANDRLFDRTLEFWYKKGAKLFTDEQRFQEVAAYANITPHAIGLLDKFFSKAATSAERDELNDWLEESQANEQLFELLLELDFRENPIAVISLLRRMVPEFPHAVTTRFSHAVPLEK